MNDFGGKLRLAREQRGLTIRQLAATTRISVAVLEALERNDVSKLPGGIFGRAFVRSYAGEVGLDPEETIREFVERFDAEPPQSLERTAAEQAAAFNRRSLAGVLALVLIGLAVAALGVAAYFYLQAPGSASPDRPSAAVAIAGANERQYVS